MSIRKNSFRSKRHVATSFLCPGGGGSPPFPVTFRSSVIRKKHDQTHDPHPRDRHDPHHRQQIERVVQIGAKIGLDQEKQHREILKAITRNFDAMIGVLDERTRKSVFGALIEVATVTDAKRIKMHQSFVDDDAAAVMPPFGQQRLTHAELRKEQE